MKKTILIILSSIICFTLCTSCNDEPAMIKFEYEKPITTMLSAFSKSDNTTFLNCFTAGAREKFETKNPDTKITELVNSSVINSVGENAKLNYTMDNRNELDKRKITKLEQAYTDAYKSRIDIKKAYTLSLKLTCNNLINPTDYTQDIEITVVKVDGSWYIYGDVITEFKLELQSN